MSNEIVESDICGATTRNDQYCNKRTRHPSGKCPWHRSQAERFTLRVDPPKNAKVKPEIFTREISNNVGRMYDEKPIKSKSVFLRFGQGELELSWSHGMQAFEIKSMHKGLRDGMTVIPDCSNRVFIRVGER